MSTHRINRDNYEAFLLDYAEGTLAAEIVAELVLFLAQNPDLAVDLDEIKDQALLSDEVSFMQKESLKRSEYELVSEEQFVGYIEGQLSTEEKDFVEKSVEANPLLQKELNLYKRSVLVPDTEIIFEDKASLKRRNKVFWLHAPASRYAAAAALLLLVGLSVFWINRDSIPQDQPVAYEKHSQTIHTPVKEQNHIASATAKQTDPDANLKKQETGIKKQERDPVQPHHTEPKIVDNMAMHSNQPALTSTASAEQNQAPLVHTNEPVQNNENTLALVKPSKTQPVTVIEEEEEGDDLEPAKKKTNLWAMAGKALKNLNKAGVKQVDGNERAQSGNTAYSLTFGGLHVTRSQKP